MSIRHALPAALLTAFIAACGGGDKASQSEGTGASSETSTTAEVEEGRSMLDVIREEPRFSTLRAAIEAADLEATFEEEGPMTLFAPNNEAFANLPEAASVEVLTAPANRDLLREILAYHVVPGRVQSSDLVGKASETETLNGTPLRYDGTGAVIQVGQVPATAVVTIPDIEATNGVVHVVDAVLLPPSE
ncbi:fasciclin domain-containing protein [Parvularcula lutaonensis]|uniref:Fasciclin domain-containing protein n=1 Tax=Parvularcula lutaonensis TaxID=491923 RepID=A0ABV7MBC9_9PROT|nr:fasciclin domain-containing protein [Parvularcula lutaonensis]GGY39536.1 hypothetical protein GCM10007148_04810 [Parvularcula lutaonensis]